MKNYLFILICGLAIFCTSGCVRSADELCGVDTTWLSNLGTEPVSERLDPLNNSRIFIFEDFNTPENICADEHSTAYFRLVLKDNKFPADTKASGVAYWGANFIKTVTLKPGDTGLSDIGLKQAFKDKPAWIGLQIIFEFPTQGSLQKDKEFFSEHVKECSITYYYSEHI
jgi:hypothetical protein